MKADKVRNLTDDELRHQERELADQLFKLKFQLNMGQTESLKKIREMRKDIARINTVAREKQIAAATTAGARETRIPPGTAAGHVKPVALKAKPVAAKTKPVKAQAHKPAAAKK